MSCLGLRGLCLEFVAGAALRVLCLEFAWQAQHLELCGCNLRGRRGTWGCPREVMYALASSGVVPGAEGSVLHFHRTHSHTTWLHTTDSHTTKSHTTCTHTQLTHTHITHSHTHNLLTHAELIHKSYITCFFISVSLWTQAGWKLRDTHIDSWHLLY